MVVLAVRFIIVASCCDYYEKNLYVFRMLFF